MTTPRDQPEKLRPVEVIVAGWSDSVPFPNADRKQVDRHSTFRTFVLAPGAPVCLLNHIPSREVAVLTIVGQSTDIGYLCGAQGDAQAIANSPAPSGQNEPGQIVMGLQVLTVYGTDEVWAVSGGTVFAIGVQAVYKDVK